jgi:hypothetical protein
MDRRTDRQRELDELRATQTDDMLFLGVRRDGYGVVPGPIPATALEREVLESELRRLAAKLRTDAIAQQCSESESMVRARLAHNFLDRTRYDFLPDVESVVEHALDDARRTSAPNTAHATETAVYVHFVLFAEAVEAASPVQQA